MPPDSDAVPAQILLKLGEMGAQLAVISEQLKDIPDHEHRIRLLEQAAAAVVQVPDHETRLRILERARWPVPTISAVSAAGAAAAAWLAYVRK
jgi:hypothetical protein